MLARLGPLLLVLLLSACGGGQRIVLRPESATHLECVPFARDVSGVQLYGDAATWWDQAAGRYPRSHTPEPGAVLVFSRSGRLPHGHVSVVSRVISDREITVTHANWVRHRIGREEPVTDVSASGDWSAVRVWWAPTGAMGTGAYAASGFVGPAGARTDLLAAR